MSDENVFSDADKVEIFGHGEKDLMVPKGPIILEDGRKIFIRGWKPEVVIRDVVSITIEGFLASAEGDIYLIDQKRGNK